MTEHGITMALGSVADHWEAMNDNAVTRMMKTDEVEEDLVVWVDNGLYGFFW